MFFQLKEISADWFENIQLKSIIYTKTKSKFQSLTTRQEEILVVANQCVTEENPPWLRKGEEVKVLTETLKKHCDSLSSKLNKKDGKSSKLNVRNIDKRMEWKKKKN